MTRLLITLCFFLTLHLYGEPQLPSPLVDVKTISPTISVDLRYASDHNFLKKNVYGKATNCRLIAEAAKMLSRAQDLLKARLPGHSLLLWDCVRPRSVQSEMWGLVKGTPKEKYVANPVRGSVHNYGCAVDLTIADQDGKPIDMGTDFDHFGVEAEPGQETKLLRSGGLKAPQVLNRLLLRMVMIEAGFLPLDHEWWHFDCMALDKLKKTQKIVETF